MRKINSRNEFPALLCEMGLIGVGVEVGTYRGDFAALLLDYWPGVLHCVDPWVHQADWPDLLNHAQKEMNGCYCATCDKLEPFGRRAVIHRMTSAWAAKNGEVPGPLDFVYLDARHDAPHVYNDMEAWAPKIKRGGILAGHDYLNGQHGPTTFDVKAQVDQWMAAHGYKADELMVTDGDPYPSWILQLSH